jgi:hypothetical protein
VYTPESVTDPPSWVDHVTAVLAVPVTVAVKETESPSLTNAAGGEIVIHIDGAVHGITETVASALALEFAVDASTWNVPIVLGAVYTPELVTVPPDVPSRTDQITAVLAIPATVATKESDLRSSTEPLAGEMVRDTGEEEGGIDGGEGETDIEGVGDTPAFPQAVSRDMPSKSGNSIHMSLR